MPPDLAASACREIVELHDAFTAWLGRGEGDPARFAAALDPAFVMIRPDGTRMDRAATLAMLHAGRAARGAEFAITVEQLEVLHAAQPLVLVHYLERQGATLRRSAALFRDAAPSPVWLFVQETWITPP